MGDVHVSHVWKIASNHRCPLRCRCVGIWQHDRVEIIPNDQGNRVTPSYVAFTDTDRLVGDAAKDQVSHQSTVKDLVIFKCPPLWSLNACCRTSAACAVVRRYQRFVKSLCTSSTESVQSSYEGGSFRQHPDRISRKPRKYFGK